MIEIKKKQLDDFKKLLTYIKRDGLLEYQHELLYKIKQLEKEIRDLRYTFGDELGQYSGRIKSIAELEEMENEFGEFRVYTVEVCLDCGWNHLIYSYLLGDGRTRKAPRKVHTLEDDDWKAPKELKSWHLHEESLRGNRRR